MVSVRLPPSPRDLQWDTMDPQWDSSADVDKDGKADAKATFVVNDANDTLRLAIFSRSLLPLPPFPPRPPSLPSSLPSGRLCPCASPCRTNASW